LKNGLSPRKLENVKNAGQESMGKCKINNAIKIIKPPSTTGN
jgi:hypothetical protein